MKAIIKPFQNSKLYQSIDKSRQEGKYPLLLSACEKAQKSHLIASLSKEDKCSLVLTYRDESARQLYEDLSFFDPGAVLYPSKDILFYNADVHSNQLVRKRMAILERLGKGEPLTIVACFDSIMEKMMPFEQLNSKAFSIDYDSVIDTAAMRLRLTEMGYEANGLVEKPGDFSIRGDIIDIYPLTEEYPVRVELWGDQIDSIRSFNTESQRSIENIEKVTVYPAIEMIVPEDKNLDVIKAILSDREKQFELLKKEKLRDSMQRLRKTTDSMLEELRHFGRISTGESMLTYYYDHTECLLNYLPEDTQIFLDEPVRSALKGEACEEEFSMSMTSRLKGGYILPKQADLIYSYEESVKKLHGRELYMLRSGFEDSEDFIAAASYEMRVKLLPSYNNSFEQLILDLEKWTKDKYKVILLSSSATRAKRLAKDILERDLKAFYTKDPEKNAQAGEIMLLQGRLSAGFEYPELKLVILTEEDIFKAKKSVRASNYQKFQGHKGKKIQSIDDISIGDYVVHERYGLGIYRGMEKIEKEGVAKDYITIEYKDNSRLFIPAFRLELIQKYVGSGNAAPKLNKLGGNEWEKTKSKVRAQVQIAAQDLVNLYAKRQSGQGHAYTEDTIWQKEFEELFPYEETDDQLLAIQETKKDMESPKIMDRLICGDVGYGKTEVAIRAAFKAVMDSKQVAFLVPTTILAKQHYDTIKARMSHYPIQIGVLSRLTPAKEEKQTKEELKSGKMDIVVGTHKLLSSKIAFKNLGLLIIDEEQRFGVKQKEKIKELKKDVDVIALSATPIPRTLHMSMAGIRDMSLLTIPPVDRRSVQTYVLEYNEEMVREAIQRELAREGQVYYVYNRVNDISTVTAKLAEIVPDARIEYAHGKMPSRQLEDIMMRFIKKEIDVLVSTTIIETGLDIPNANTMIIHNAQNFGLSQLYQLRGRVGRSNRTAYAFLMYERDRMLTETAEARLKAIREFTDLGSGFKVAMRDLEIRGAGNLLGAQQSGHIEAVGYELYCKMLNEAIVAMQEGQSEEEIFHTTLDLNVDAFIPGDYVENESQKLALYKRIMLIDDQDEAEDMKEELTDRYGDVPSALLRLIEVVLLKVKAHDAWITSVEQKGDKIHFVMNPRAKVRVEEIDGFLKCYGRKMKLPPAKEPTFVFDASGVLKKDLLSVTGEIIEQIQSRLLEKEGQQEPVK